MCSASESQTGQPTVSRRCTRTAIRWPLLSIDLTGLSDVSPQDAPLFEKDALSGEPEPISIGHGGVFQSPQWQAVFPADRLRSPTVGWKLGRLKLLVLAAIKLKESGPFSSVDAGVRAIAAPNRAGLADRQHALCQPRACRSLPAW
jgi:hypothetical protein